MLASTRDAKQVYSSNNTPPCKSRPPAPQSQRHTIPNPLRPTVAAPQRLTHWLTPFGIDYMNRLSLSFPPEIVARNRLILSCSVSAATLSTYAAGLLRFTQFCDEFNIPETACMPASEALLCIFITSHGTGHIGKGSLINWLTGLELWHTINGAPWLGKHRVSHTVKGAAASAPPSSFRPPRLPITINHLCMPIKT